MARGFGRSLDITTLMVMVRHRFQEQGETAFSMRFTEQGWQSWWGAGLPDEDDQKFFETLDSAILALIIGNANVPGVEDYGGG